jgi:predicted ATPase
MLKSIEINNFRSCYHTKLEFGQTICALAGKNGVGKTNILECIQWLCSSVATPEPLGITTAALASDHAEPISVHIILDIDHVSIAYSITHSILSMLPGAAGGLTESLTIEEGDNRPVEVFRREGEEIRIRDRAEPVRVARWTSAIAALDSLLPGDDPLQAYLSKITAFFTNVSYYPLVERRGVTDYVPEQSYKVWEIEFRSTGTLTDSIAFRHIYMWNEDRAMLEEFQDLIGPPGLGLLERFEIRSLEWGGNPFARIYQPFYVPSEQMGGAGRLCRFSELSDGTRRVIRMVTHLLFDKRSLMLMEQPEDSIHPGLLRKLIDLLRSYSDRSQIVFTTHSSDVLDILRPEEVVLVTANEGVTNARSLSPAEIAEARRFLRDEGSLSDYLELEPVNE